jgi:hypothetical protein
MGLVVVNTFVVWTGACSWSSSLTLRLPSFLVVFFFELGFLRGFLGVGTGTSLIKQRTMMSEMQNGVPRFDVPQFHVPQFDVPHFDVLLFDVPPFHVPGTHVLHCNAHTRNDAATGQ